MIPTIARILNKLKITDKYTSSDKTGIFNKISFTSSIKINGHKFRIPVVQKLGWNNLFLSDSWMDQILAKLLVDNGSFIDVGANIGQTLIRAKSIQPGLTYVAFEPNPACIYYLNLLIKKNGFPNTEVVPVGVSDKTGILKLHHYIDSPTDQSASVIAEFRPGSKIFASEYVPLFAFSDIELLSTLDAIQVIKIDVEGAELEVLLSASALIKKHRPFIIIELLPVYNAGNTHRMLRMQKIEELIHRLEYNIFRIEKDRHENLVGLKELDSIGIHGNILDIDYLLVPNEKTKSGNITGLINFSV